MNSTPHIGSTRVPRVPDGVPPSGSVAAASDEITHASQVTHFTGTVKYWNETRGYGFIKRDGLPDLFVHATHVVGAKLAGEPKLREGDFVTFQMGHNKQGPAATEVIVQVQSPKSQVQSHKAARLRVPTLDLGPRTLDTIP